MKGPNRGLSWVGQGQRGVWELAAGSGTAGARLRPGRHSPPLMDEPGPMVLLFPGTRGTRRGGGQRAWQRPRAWAPGATVLGSGGQMGQIPRSSSWVVWLEPYGRGLALHPQEEGCPQRGRGVSQLTGSPHPTTPCTRYTPGTPCSPDSVHKWPPATPQPGSPSPTLPTSNDHDHDFVSCGECR